VRSNTAQVLSKDERYDQIKPIATNSNQNNHNSVSDIISPPSSPEKTQDVFSSVPTPTKRKPSIVINPFYDNILTAIFFVEIASLLYLFIFIEKDLAAVLTIAITTMVTAYGVSMSRSTFARIAILVGSPKALAKSRNIRKFVDQAWQLVIHGSMTIFECYIIYGQPWLWNVATAWDDVQIRPRGAVQQLYLIQLGVRIWSSFSHRFIEAKHKDYFLMFTHHVVTISLLGGSYQGGFYKIGTLVLLVHNGSDIVVDLLKLTNYMDRAGRQYCFCTEILFVIQLITWSIWRLWYFPVYIIYSSLYEQKGCELDCKILRSFLFILLAMHWWWFYLFLRIGYRLVTAKSAHGAAREEYEGGSSDEEDSRKKLRTQPPSNPKTD